MRKSWTRAVPSCTLVADTLTGGRDMGRKKKMTEEKVDIRLRVDAELAGRIQKAADQEGNSVAAFIRAAVVRELNRREKEGGA